MLFNDEDEKIFTTSEPLLILQKKEEEEEEDEDLLGEKAIKEEAPPKTVNEDDNIVFTLSDSTMNPLKQFSLALLNYAKIHNFLITWKRLEVLKLDWIRRKTTIITINDPNIFAKSM